MRRRGTRHTRPAERLQDDIHKRGKVLHKHRSSAKALLKQQYDYAIGNARMHKKYLKDFNAGYNLTMIALKTLQAIATYPLTIIKALRSGDATYCLAEPVIDVAVLSMHAAGLIRETFFGKPYTGEKYPEKVPFLPDQSAEAIWRKMLEKGGAGGMKRCWLPDFSILEQ